MNAQIRGLLERCFPYNRVSVVRSSPSGYTGRSGTCFILSVYMGHLRCLLPQHGPGRKHEREIVLEPWQAKLLERAPWGFIRGCIRSDGCAFVNRTDIHRDVPYEYLSYDFSNLSEHIARLFVAACDMVGLTTRLNRDSRGRWDVRINRRESVALMLERVGRNS